MKKYIKNANQVLTIGKKLSTPLCGSSMKDIEVIENGSIYIEGEYIKWVGKDGECPFNITSDVDVIDASNKVIMPGLVDCHTHTVFGGTRENEYAMRLEGKSYLEIAEQGGGINSSVRTTREASHQNLKASGLKRLDEAFQWGITTIEIKSGYGLNYDSEIKMLEVINELDDIHPIGIVSTFLGGHEIPYDYKERKDEYLKLLIEEITPEVGRRKLAKFCDVFCEKGVFEVEDSKRILEAGKKYGMVPRLHADEFFPIGGAELSAEIGATSADHLHKISDKGIEMMKERKVVAVMLPGVSAFLNMDYPPARKLIDKGMALAIATDFNPGSCMSQSLPLMMSLSCTRMRLTVEEVITASTINAACVLKLEDEIGSIEEGKRADLIILDIPNYYMMLYHFGTNHVSTVIKNGKAFSIPKYFSNV